MILGKNINENTKTGSKIQAWAKHSSCTINTVAGTRYAKIRTQILYSEARVTAYSKQFLWYLISRVWTNAQVVYTLETSSI